MDCVNIRLVRHVAGRIEASGRERRRALMRLPDALFLELVGRLMGREPIDEVFAWFTTHQRVTRSGFYRMASLVQREYREVLFLEAVAGKVAENIGDQITTGGRIHLPTSNAKGVNSKRV